MAGAAAHIDRQLQPARRPKIGFVGLGWIGRKRLQSAVAGADLDIIALADPDESRLQLAALDCPEHQPVCVRTLEALLEHSLDGVVIATPTGLHAQQALEALRRGIAVFCQKPLGASAADSGAVVEAAREVDRLLMVDYCYRYLAGMGELRERVRRGALGELLAADLTFHNAYAPSNSWCLDRRLAGGGCLADLGIHLVDLLLWLYDYPPIRVVTSHLFSQGAAVSPPLDGRIEDLALAQLRMGHGAIVRVACSWNRHAGRDAIIELALHGARAGAGWRNVDGSFYDFTVELWQGANRELLGGHPDEWGGRALRDWLQRLADGAGFCEEALGIVAGARLIDECYARSAEPGADAGADPGVRAESVSP